MNKISTKLCKKRRSISLIVGAVVLHIISMYIVVCLQDLACAQCSPLAYMIIKLILRWFYLLVPICFMRMEHITLDEIGITTNKLFTQVITGIVIGSSAAIIIVAEIEDYCIKNLIKHTNFFYHEKLVADKKAEKVMQI